MIRLGLGHTLRETLVNLRKDTVMRNIWLAAMMLSALGVSWRP